MSNGGSDEWLTSGQISEELQISTRTLDHWAYERRGPTFAKVGRQRRYRRADLDAWLIEQKVETAGR